MFRSVVLVIVALLLFVVPTASAAMAKTSDDFYPETSLDDLILRVDEGGGFWLEEELFTGFRVKNGSLQTDVDEDVARLIEEAGIEDEYVFGAQFTSPGDEYNSVVSNRVLTFDDVDDAADYPRLLLDDAIERETDIYEDIEELDDDDLPEFNGVIVGWQGTSEYEGGTMNPFKRYIAQAGHAVFSVSVFGEDMDDIDYMLGELFDAQWDCVENDEECETMPFPDPGEAVTNQAVALLNRRIV